MSKKIIYGLILFILLCWLILLDIFNPAKGLIYVVEESFALAMIILGVIVLNRPIKRFINWLNIKYSWKTAVKRRIGIELMTIVIGASMISAAFTVPLSLYVESYGVPQFYADVLDAKTASRDAYQHHKGPNTAKKIDYRKDWKTSDFGKGVLQGSLLCLLIIFVIEEAYDRQERQAQKILDQQILLKEQAQLRANVLKKQLDPHFMFNTLNVLSGLIYKDLDGSAQFIKELSKVYRYVLEQSEELVSTIEKEFQFLDSYLFLLKIRFEEKIHININVAKTYREWLIPSMTLELLVENAIKHNVIDQSSPLQIGISIHNDKLVVTNNLQLRNSRAESLGVGLSNLRKRLELLELGDYSFEAVDNQFVAIIPLLSPDNV